MLRIGAVTLDNWLVMAPMAGITNLPFRLMVKRLGAGLVFTEMISAKGLTLHQKRTLDYLDRHPEEGTLAVQIFGDQPNIMKGMFFSRAKRRALNFTIAIHAVHIVLALVSVCF